MFPALSSKSPPFQSWTNFYANPGRATSFSTSSPNRRDKTIFDNLESRATTSQAGPLAFRLALQAQSAAYATRRT